MTSRSALKSAKEIKIKLIRACERATYVQTWRLSHYMCLCKRTDARIVPSEIRKWLGLLVNFIFLREDLVLRSIYPIRRSLDPDVTNKLTCLRQLSFPPRVYSNLGFSIKRQRREPESMWKREKFIGLFVRLSFPSHIQLCAK